jgi:hypothetical protein
MTYTPLPKRDTHPEKSDRPEFPVQIPTGFTYSPSISSPAVDNAQLLETGNKVDPGKSDLGRGNICTGWLWELVSVMFSLSTSAALVIVLTIYNDSTVPKLPYGISVRTSHV